MDRRASRHMPPSADADDASGRASLDQRSPAVGDAAPVQAWRAWADCGDGGQVHLIVDSAAQQVWLLPESETNHMPRSA